MAGVKTTARHADLCEAIFQAGGQIWSPYHEDIRADQVAQAQDIGRIVNVWTVNTIPDIDRMIDLGVDRIISDYPGRAQRCLVERNLNWRNDPANLE